MYGTICFFFVRIHEKKDFHLMLKNYKDNFNLLYFYSSLIAIPLFSLSTIWFLD